MTVDLMNTSPQTPWASFINATKTKALHTRSPRAQRRFGSHLLACASIALVLSACLPLARANANDAALHTKIDALLQAAHAGIEAPLASDSEFLRRAYLTLTGNIPTSSQARAFFADAAPDKRARLIDQLVGTREFVRWMAVRFDIMLMERRAEKHVKAPGWQQFLEDSFAANKPWDHLVREILSVDGTDEKTRPMARWILEREADPHALTRDVGRMFLGRDISCAQCHDHPRVEDYTQRDYYGLEAFFSRTYLFQPDANKPGMVGEKADGETTYNSVFTKVGGTTRPRLPGRDEIAEPTLAPAELWTVPPNDKDKNVRPVPKYSRRALLATALTDGADPAFRRNIANRLWHLVFGRGLVEPLDLHHSANPPANPALLDLLAEAIAAMKFDMKAFVREVALTRAFQRSLELPEPPAGLAESIAVRAPALEESAKTLATAATSSNEEWRKAREAIIQAQRASEPLHAELKKYDGAVAAAKKEMDAAQAEVKKAEDALGAKRDVEKSLADAVAKANEALAQAPEAAELVQVAKTFRGKADQIAGEIPVAEKEVTAKKADAEAKTQALLKTQQVALAARAKVEEASRNIAALQTALDAAAARKHVDRIKALHAARLASDAKALLAWVPAAATDRAARAHAIRAEAALAAAVRATERLRAEVAGGPAKLAALTTAAEIAASDVAKAQGAMTQRRPAATALGEASAKAAEAAAKLPKDADVQSAATALKTKAAAVAAEVAALEKAANEAPAKAEAAAKLLVDAKTALEKAQADLPAAEQQVAPLDAVAAEARNKATATAPLTEALSRRCVESFAATELTPLLPEQLCWSAMQATGVWEQQRSQAAAEWDKKTPLAEADKSNPAKQAERTAGIEKAFREKLRPHEEQYVRSFGGFAGQPQTDFFATPEQALYFENGGALRSWCGALAGRLAALPEPAAIAEELFLSTLTRLPSNEEVSELTTTLAERTEKKNEALTDLAWALLTSVEFRFSH